MTWSFHEFFLQKNLRYDLIIGQDLLLEFKLDLCFSDYTIKDDGGAYKVWTDPMTYPSGFRDDKSFRNEE